MNDLRPNLLERGLAVISPRWALQRFGARVAMSRALSGYKSGRPHRLNRERNLASGTGDEHLDERSLWELREISRDLDRDSALAGGVIDRACENICGSAGFGLKPKVADKTQRTAIKSSWWDWQCDGADVRGKRHLTQIVFGEKMQSLVAGDTLLQKRVYRKVPQVVPIEPERLITPSDFVSDATISHGIRTDRFGAPVAYFIADEIPANGFVNSTQGRWVKADEILHFYSPRRTSQSRGVPILASVIRDVDDIDDVITAERVLAKLSAMAGFQVTKTGDAGVVANLMADSTGTTAKEDRLEDFVPGLVAYLNSGEKMEAVGSNRPSAQFEAFIHLCCRHVGLPLGLPLELVLLDFSKVNFASSRQLLNQAQLHFRKEQFDLDVGMWRKLYRWWLSVMLDNGTIASSSDITNHEFAYPGWPSPNPIDDVQAAVLAAQNWLAPRQTYQAQTGDDFDDVAEQLEHENQFISTATPAPAASTGVAQTPNQTSANDRTKLQPA